MSGSTMFKARRLLGEWAQHSVMMKQVIALVLPALDSFMAEGVLQPDKSAEKMEQFIISKARIELGDKPGFLPDGTVSMLATTYLLQDAPTLHEPKQISKQTVPVSTTKPGSPVEKAKSSAAPVTLFDL